MKGMCGDSTAASQRWRRLTLMLRDELFHRLQPLSSCEALNMGEDPRERHKLESSPIVRSRRHGFFCGSIPYEGQRR